MILVDSSVWIDYFRGHPTAECDRLDSLIGVELVGVGDLMLTEVLQGFDTEREFNEARRLMTMFTAIEIGGHEIAVEAARNFRRLRTLGITVRKTIDTLIATRCIEDDLLLLHADRDFDPFVKHLGLRSVL